MKPMPTTCGHRKSGQGKWADARQLSRLLFSLLLGSALLFSSVGFADEPFCTATWKGNPADRPDRIADFEVVNSVVLREPPRVRRDVKDPASGPDRVAFAEAVRILKSRDGNPDDVKHRGLVLTAYEAVRASHDHPAGDDDLEPDLPSRDSHYYPDTLWANCVHGVDPKDPDVSLFLLWHRAYVRAFEISANSVVAAARGKDFQGFGIPYWNWVNDRAFPAALRCEDGNTTVICPRKLGSSRKCFENLGSAGDRNHSNPLYADCRARETRTTAPLWSPVPGVNPLSTTHSDFLKFNTELEAPWHDVIHQVVGGTESIGSKVSNGWMVKTHYAVFDPAFWVHHAFVDRLLSGWISAVSNRDPDARQDLLEQAGPGSPLETAWQTKKAIFPVICGDKFVWYQPRFADLAPILNGVSDDERLGYTYDAITLPKLDTLKQPDLVRLIETLPVKSSDLPSLVVSGSTTSPLQWKLNLSGSGFTVAGRNLVARISLSSLNLDSALLARLKQAREQKQKKLLSVVGLQKLERRAVVVSLDNARLDAEPTSMLSYVVMARICSSLSPCPASPWRYVSTVGVFGLPVNGSTAAVPGSQGIAGSHAGHHASPVIDVTDVLIVWLKRANFVIAKDAKLDLAIVPAFGTIDGKLVPVPADENPGLSFDSMTVWLKPTLGSGQTAAGQPHTH